MAGVEDQALLGKLIMAYRKIFTVDVATVTETFIDARDKTAMLVGRLTEQTGHLVEQQSELSTVSETLAAAAQESHASATTMSDPAGQMATQADGANELVSRSGFGTIRHAVGETATALQTIVVAGGSVAHSSSELSNMSEEVARTAERLTEVSGELAQSIDGARELVGEAGRK